MVLLVPSPVAFGGLSLKGLRLSRCAKMAFTMFPAMHRLLLIWLRTRMPLVFYRMPLENASAIWRTFLLIPPRPGEMKQSPGCWLPSICKP